MLLGFSFDEIAIGLELANERVHLPQTQWRLEDGPFEILPYEAVVVDFQLERGGASFVHTSGPVFLGQGQNALDTTNTGLAFPVVQTLTEHAGVGTGLGCATEQVDDADGSALRSIFRSDAVSATLLLASMFA